MCLLRASSGEAFAESIPCSWARRLRPPTCCPLLSLDLCTRWQALSILSCSTSPTSASSLLPEVPVQLPLTDSCPLSAWTWFPDSHGWSECLPSLFPKPPFHGDLDTQCKGGGHETGMCLLLQFPEPNPIAGLVHLALTGPGYNAPCQSVIQATSHYLTIEIVLEYPWPEWVTLHYSIDILFSTSWGFNGIIMEIICKGLSVTWLLKSVLLNYNRITQRGFSTKDSWEQLIFYILLK